MSTLRVDNLRGQTADGTNRYIVQVVQNTPTTTTHITIIQSPPTMAEVSTTFRTTITPKFASSLLRLNFQCLIGGRNSSSIMGIKFFDITNSSNVGFSSLGTGSSRTFVNASVRTKDHDANDRDHLNMTAYQSANNTNSRTYTIQAYKEADGTMDFNMTGTDNSGCSYAPPVFTIEEIAQ
tara:strand:+ start:585 stop:1124 length:540 start_codon:yes stop_codon:yes gene_type:complete